MINTIFLIFQVSTMLLRRTSILCKLFSHSVTKLNFCVVIDCTPKDYKAHLRYDYTR